MIQAFTWDGRKLGTVNPFSDPVTDFDHAFWDQIIEDFV